MQSAAASAFSQTLVNTCTDLLKDRMNFGDNQVKRRTRKGCYTCRLRRKKCPEQTPICATCQKLELCCTYVRPEWWRRKNLQDSERDRIKEFVKRRRKETSTAHREQRVQVTRDDHLQHSPLRTSQDEAAAIAPASLRSPSNGPTFPLASAKGDIGPGNYNHAQDGEQLNQHGTAYLENRKDGTELDGHLQVNGEDDLRRLGALVIELQMLQKRSSNLKEHIHTEEEVASIEVLESEAQNRAGRVNVLEARMMELDKEIGSLQNQRTNVEREQREAYDLYVAARGQVDLACARRDKIAIANERLLEVHRQQRERRTELRID